MLQTVSLFVFVLSCIVLAFADLNDNDSMNRGPLDISEYLRNGNIGTQKHRDSNPLRDGRVRDKGKQRISEMISRFDKMFKGEMNSKRKRDFKSQKQLDFTADKIPEVVIENNDVNKLFGYGYGSLESVYGYGSGWTSQKKSPGTFDSPPVAISNVPIPYTISLPGTPVSIHPVSSSEKTTDVPKPLYNSRSPSSVSSGSNSTNSTPTKNPPRQELSNSPPDVFKNVEVVVGKENHPASDYEMWNDNEYVKNDVWTDNDDEKNDDHVNERYEDMSDVVYQYHHGNNNDDNEELFSYERNNGAHNVHSVHSDDVNGYDNDSVYSDDVNGYDSDSVYSDSVYSDDVNGYDSDSVYSDDVYDHDGVYSDDYNGGVYSDDYNGYDSDSVYSDDINGYDSDSENFHSYFNDDISGYDDSDSEMYTDFNDDISDYDDSGSMYSDFNNYENDSEMYIDFNGDSDGYGRDSDNAPFFSDDDSDVNFDFNNYENDSEMRTDFNDDVDDSNNENIYSYYRDDRATNEFYGNTEFEYKIPSRYFQHKYGHFMNKYRDDNSEDINYDSGDYSDNGNNDDNENHNTRHY